MSTDATSFKPILFVVMGVSGCGKSSVAEAVSKHFKNRLLDADDFHSAEAKAYMAAERPLTDEMRLPWVIKIRNHLLQWAHKGQNYTLAFSGLKKSHRDIIRDCGFRVIFIFLSGPKAIVLRRLQDRTNHFMPLSLLESQYDSLESPLNETDVLPVDISPALSVVIEQTIEKIYTVL